MEALQAQEQFDFNCYFKAYYQEMYYIAKRIVHNHYTAEDVIQEAYIKAYRNYVYLSDHAKGRAWLRTIVIRTAIDFYRKETKYSVASVEAQAEEGHECCVATKQVQDQFDYQVNIELIQQALLNLPIRLRQVIELKLTNDLSDAKIAEKLNISLSAVKTRLHRARKQLILWNPCHD
ncbi:RNA polymerase sigma-70 factor, ECF subfamily [Amphibacillus marinus]|uniref:RNA polymerase sigma factor n=1 Tax=Amphibacillus marinus TaxID=872970 RepID=A0A1H8IFJ4_9BACI|nr:RNA polymerase sigma factor [Amphibacillus marinus]SEN66787.1 RNA polymerase sigma-70 factor, ECF subfamily [Amphibacillus marinus]